MAHERCWRPTALCVTGPPLTRHNKFGSIMYNLDLSSTLLPLLIGHCCALSVRCRWSLRVDPGYLSTVKQQIAILQDKNLTALLCESVALPLSRAAWQFLQKAGQILPFSQSPYPPGIERLIYSCNIPTEPKINMRREEHGPSVRLSSVQQFRSHMSATILDCRNGWALARRRGCGEAMHGWALRD